eukprot:COSAG01_NODE_652_length_14497_cov_38.547968_14_plen_180_part_00
MDSLQVLVFNVMPYIRYVYETPNLSPFCTFLAPWRCSTWWYESMSADAAPVMHAKDLFDPFAKWHLANDGQWASGRAILWILQLMHALNAAELKYDELRADFQRLGFQVLRKRVQDAAMWAASGQRLGGGTPTMACHILATAQVEPSAILRWPELQHRILRGATQRDVLELIAAQEPAH